MGTLMHATVLDQKHDAIAPATGAGRAPEAVLPQAFRRVASGRLLERLPVGVYCCDPRGRLLQFNQKAAELWGRRPALGENEELYCGSHRLLSLVGERIPHRQSPMAEVLRTGRPVHDQTVVIERPDGSRLTALVNIEPVFEEDGSFAGAVNCFQDITGLRRAQEAVEAKERHLHALLDALPGAVYTTDEQGRVTFYNQAAVDLVGCRPELGRSEWCVSFRLFWPDGRPMPHDQCPMALAIRERRAIRGGEAVAERPDGTRVPFMAFPTPLFDDAGRLVGAVNMLVDMSEKKEAEHQQQLLIAELNHRVKNTLAVVQAIASHTLRNTRSPTEFVASFSGRLQALARAHSRLAEAVWRGAGLIDLVHDQLPLGGTDERVTCSGPAVVLAPQVALHLAMSLHELGTNAAKYGALSAPSGRLSITWAIDADADRNLVLRWSERGGPAVVLPVARGFGTSLIEQSMQVHGGELRLSYRPDGLDCELRLPLPEQRPGRGVAPGPIIAP